MVSYERYASPLRDAAIVVAGLLLAGWGAANAGAFVLSHCNDDAQSDRPGAAACDALLGGGFWLAVLAPTVAFAALVWLTRERPDRARMRGLAFLALVALPLAANVLLRTL